MKGCVIINSILFPRLEALWKQSVKDAVNCVQKICNAPNPELTPAEVTNGQHFSFIICHDSWSSTTTTTTATATAYLEVLTTMHSFVAVKLNR